MYLTIVTYPKILYEKSVCIFAVNQRVMLIVLEVVIWAPQ